MATGITLWLLAPDEPAVKKKVSVGVEPSKGGFTARVGGTW
jgi:hypothetical protein